MPDVMTRVDFDALLLQQYQYVLWKALLLTKNSEKAQELVQDTMLRALEQSHRFQAGTNFRAWVSKVMENLWFDQTRKSLKRQFIHLPLLDGVDSVVHVDLGREIDLPVIRRTLDKALAQLSEDDQYLVKLRLGDKIRFKRLSPMFDGVSPNALKIRVSRAKKALRRVVKEELGEYATAN